MANNAWQRTFLCLTPARIAIIATLLTPRVMPPIVTMVPRVAPAALNNGDLILHQQTHLSIQYRLFRYHGLSTQTVVLIVTPPFAMRILSTYNVQCLIEGTMCMEIFKGEVREGLQLMASAASLSFSIQHVAHSRNCSSHQSFHAMMLDVL